MCGPGPGPAPRAAHKEGWRGLGSRGRRACSAVGGCLCCGAPSLLPTETGLRPRAGASAGGSRGHGGRAVVAPRVPVREGPGPFVGAGEPAGRAAIEQTRAGLRGQRACS